MLDGPASARTTIVLAHGTGAPMDSPFMTFFAEGLAAAGLRIVRFEFPYMAARRRGGSRRPPDRTEVLVAAWRRVLGSVPSPRPIVGGKSLGGRIAALVAGGGEVGDTMVGGLVCLGYPFHPPGRPDRLRVEPLRRLDTPTLIVQGSRDPFGGRDEAGGYDLPSSVRFAWIEDGDHGFVPRRRSDRTERQNLEQALAAVVGFIDTLAPGDDRG
jgi:hypothetical protein